MALTLGTVLASPSWVTQACTTDVTSLIVALDARAVLCTEFSEFIVRTLDFKSDGIQKQKISKQLKYKRTVQWRLNYKELIRGVYFSCYWKADFCEAVLVILYAKKALLHIHSWVKTDLIIYIKKMRHHEFELREPKCNCITLITNMLRLHTC